MCRPSVYVTYTYISSTHTDLVNSSATREHNRFRRNLVILSINIRGFHRVDVKPETFSHFRPPLLYGIPVDAGYRCRYRFLMLTISGRTGTIITIEPHRLAGRFFLRFWSGRGNTECYLRYPRHRLQIDVSSYKSSDGFCSHSSSISGSSAFYLGVLSGLGSKTNVCEKHVVVKRTGRRLITRPRVSEKIVSRLTNDLWRGRQAGHFFAVRLLIARSTERGRVTDVQKNSVDRRHL